MEADKLLAAKEASCIYELLQCVTGKCYVRIALALFEARNFVPFKDGSKLHSLAFTGSNTFR